VLTITTEKDHVAPLKSVALLNEMISRGQGVVVVERRALA
jgi:hypothetical protein